MPLKQLTLEELEAALRIATNAFYEDDKSIDLEVYEVIDDIIAFNFVDINGEESEFSFLLNSLRIVAEDNHITLTDGNNDLHSCQFSLYKRAPVIPGEVTV